MSNNCKMRIAVIPARGGSKRIPRKNIKSFAGKSMITHAIGVAQSSGLFDHIVISTDDGETAPLAVNAKVLHAYHLYVVKIDFKSLGIDRTTLFTNLSEKGMGVNVHYIPVHLHSFYREKFHAGLGLCPGAETAYEQIISLHMFPGMTDEDVENVINVMQDVILQNQDK